MTCLSLIKFYSLLITQSYHFQSCNYIICLPELKKPFKKITVKIQYIGAIFVSMLLVSKPALLFGIVLKLGINELFLGLSIYDPVRFSFNIQTQRRLLLPKFSFKSD